MVVRTARELGALARERRKHLGLSQEQLAEKAGVRRLWIVQFENGKSTSQLGLALRTLNALGITLRAATDEKQPPGGTGPAEIDIDLDDVLRQSVDDSER